MSVPELVPDNLVLCGGSGADLEYGWLVSGEPDHYDVVTVKSLLMISCTNSMMPSAKGEAVTPVRVAISDLWQRTFERPK